MEKLTLEGLLGDLNLAQEATEIKVRPPSVSRDKTPRQAFISAVQRQLNAANECATKHKISEIDGKQGRVLTIVDSKPLEPPLRGKPAHWFMWKGGLLVVSVYFRNANVFPPIGLRSWESVIKYYQGLIEVAAAGKLDENLAEIERTIREKREAKKVKKLEGSQEK